MIYKIFLTNTAVESLKKIDKGMRNRLISKIEWLSEFNKTNQIKGQFFSYI